MKIQFIKDHGSNHKGLIVECGKTRALRFIEDNIAIEVGSEVKEEKKVIVTKEMKTPIKTKVKTKN